ncbi:MAG: response regulator [Desulfuromonadaceae bacterium]
MNTDITERETQEYLKSLTVLFVEDEDDSRELLSAFLSRLVGVLVTAQNGAEGLDAWRQHKPDIIITDIRMPVMDGLSMLQEIRTVDTEVPVIILSAFESSDYLKQSIDLGVCGYVFKPVDSAKFTKLLLKSARGLLLEKKNHLAQVALATNFRFLQKLTEVIPGMLAYWNTELRCTFSNSAYKEWFGKTVEQMRGIHIRELMGEKLYLISEADILAALQGVACSFERSMTKVDGSIGHTTIHYIPDKFEYEVQGFFVMITDVTELKLTEKALRKQKQFARATLDGQSAHICVINAQGEIVNTNRAWDAYAVANNAASGTCCVGSNYLDALLVAVEEGQADAEEIQAGLTAVLEGTLPRFVMEYECSSPEEVRWFLARANPFVVDVESYVVISHEDITARKQIEAVLIENKKQLQSFNDQLEDRIAEEVGKNREKDSRLLHQDKMSSLGQLAAGVAHEINNPMGYIISNLASLSRYVDKLTTYLDANEQHFAGSESETWEHLAQKRKKHKIDRIRLDLPGLIAESREGAERVRIIVQDLKNFSRLDNNATKEFCDINKGLESTLSIAWNEMKYKATVNREFGQLPHVWCNIGQLNQVFLNILVNAAHAIERQGEIRIATWAESESVKISISDSGDGIAPEHVKRIFDPFFTTKEVGKGTGIGLAIAYDIVVNKHGGIIDVTSEIGEGTTLTITLPVKRENKDVICESACNNDLHPV